MAKGQGACENGQEYGDLLDHEEFREGVARGPHGSGTAARSLASDRSSRIIRMARRQWFSPPRERPGGRLFPVKQATQLRLPAAPAQHRLAQVQVAVADASPGEVFAHGVIFAERPFGRSDAGHQLTSQQFALPFLHHPGTAGALEADEAQDIRGQVHQPRFEEARAVGAQQLEGLDLAAVRGDVGEVQVAGEGGALAEGLPRLTGVSS